MQFGKYGLGKHGKYKGALTAAAMAAAGFVVGNNVGGETRFVSVAHAEETGPRAPRQAVEMRDVPCEHGWAIANFPLRPFQQIGAASALLHLPGKAGPWGRFEWMATPAMVGEGVIGAQCPWGTDYVRFIF